MSNMAENRTSNAPSDGLDTEGIQALDKRLRSSFDIKQLQELRRNDSFKKLLVGLEAGRFGGAPHTGDAPAALIAILDQLNWAHSVEQFARIIPHFADEFGIIQLRECAARLGFHSTSRVANPRNISMSHLPAILVHGQSISTLELGPDNNITARDPSSGEVRKVKWNGKCRLVSFTNVADSEEKRTADSWLATNLYRFYPEIWQMFCLTFFINLTVLVTSFAVMSIYDNVIPAGAFDTLAWIGIALVLAFSFELMFRALKSKLIGRTTGRLEYLIGSAVFSKLVSLPLHMLINTPIGDQVSR
ncbi:MAG: hypothetical protein JKY83_02020, partial [Rhizobiaceae bacterium]|nr:hypothetical protein [Rhizobiaceae bacterium]